VEDSSGEDSVLSGTFINDGTYTQHTPQVLYCLCCMCCMYCMLRVVAECLVSHITHHPYTNTNTIQGAASQYGMYLAVNNYHAHMRSPDDFVAGKLNIQAMVRGRRARGVGRGLAMSPSTSSVGGSVVSGSVVDTQCRGSDGSDSGSDGGNSGVSGDSGCDSDVSIVDTPEVSRYANKRKSHQSKPKHAMLAKQHRSKYFGGDNDNNGTNPASSGGDSCSGDSNRNGSEDECMSDNDVHTTHHNTTNAGAKKPSLLAHLTKPPRTATNTHYNTNTTNTGTSNTRKFVLPSGKENHHKKSASTTTTTTTTTANHTSNTSGTHNTHKKSTFFSKMALRGLGGDSSDDSVSDVDTNNTTSTSTSSKWLQNRPAAIKSSKSSTLSVVPTTTKAVTTNTANTNTTNSHNTHTTTTANTTCGTVNNVSRLPLLPKSPNRTEKMSIADPASPIDWGF